LTLFGHPNPVLKSSVDLGGLFDPATEIFS
jgi:hypothetical protein